MYDGLKCGNLCNMCVSWHAQIACSRLLVYTCYACVQSFVLPDHVLGSDFTARLCSHKQRGHEQ